MTSLAKQHKPHLQVTKIGIGTRGYLLAALSVVILLQIELIFSKSINWDEFYHFSEITEFNAGRPTEMFQTPYVKLFWWIPFTPGDNIFHIQLARLITLTFELATVGIIIAMTRRFVDQNAALISGLAFASGGFVFLHAFALRSDMIASAALMMSLYILMTGPFKARTLLIAVVLGGIGFICTIKSVFYGP
ncbi:MAG: hypothetical protein B7Y74_07785, partial [Novosphingobium sp. 35-62-5]